MANEEIAGILMEIADLLDLDGVPFKPESYRRAARTLEQLPQRLAQLSQQGQLQEIPGVGEAIAKKLEEYLETGKVAYLQKLRDAHPPGLIEIMRFDGVGPKTTRRFLLEFGIDSPSRLREAIDSGKLEGKRGFGPKKIALLKAVVGGGEMRGRFPLSAAQMIADNILDELTRSGARFSKLSYAGSLRRRKETVGDLDIIAVTEDRTAFIDHFVSLQDVVQVKSRGDTKATLVVRPGIQVDLRAIPPESYGAAMQYFTGSKDHNVRLRTLAQQRGLSINEYGVTANGRMTPASSEEEVYAAVGLSYIPPELRENSGEFDAAASGTLPDTPDTSEIQGELHIHIERGLTPGALEGWVNGAERIGLRYCGFVVDLESSDTSSILAVVEGLPRTIRGVKILLGTEVGGAPPARARTPSGSVDFTVLNMSSLVHAASPSQVSDVVRSVGAQGGGAYLAHMEGVTPEKMGLSWEDIAALGMPVEVAVTGDAVPMESPTVRRAGNAGVSWLASGRPTTPDEMTRIRLALGIATRGWANRSGVANLKGAEECLQSGVTSTGS